MSQLEIFEQSIEEHLTMIRSLQGELPVLRQIAERMTSAVVQGHKIVWCGNGGSAADSQHLAAELTGRFLKERRALPSVALTVNTSALTAIGNDYGYEYVFRRQVEAICRRGDVLVGISTSGSSKNVCHALETAREMGVITVAFTGANGGPMANIADLTLRVPSSATPRIQEAHILCGHMICQYVEDSVCES